MITYVVRSGNGNAVLEGVPAHVQNLLVEVDLIGIRLLLHATAGASRAAGPRSGLLAALVHGSGHTDLLRLERRLVRLEHNLRILFFLRRVNHEVVVITAGHDVLGVAGEDNLELVEDAVVFVGVAEARP